MLLAHSAIPRVPPHALIPEHILTTAFTRITDAAGSLSPTQLSQVFAQCEQSQPGLSAWMGQVLSKPIDDAARGLGAALGVTLWLAFSIFAGERLGVVREEDCEAVQKLLEVDEQLRKDDPHVVLESDDVVAVQQPAIAAFVRARLNDTLEAYADEIDVDDVDLVYRMALVEALALSYAVAAPASNPGDPGAGPS